MDLQQCILTDTLKYQPKIAAHYDQLTSDEDKKALLKELKEFPAKKWTKVFWNVLEGTEEKQKATLSNGNCSVGKFDVRPPFKWVPSLENFETFPSEENFCKIPDEIAVLTSLNEVDPECTRRWRKMGLQLFAQGAVATVIMAGGQSTRLGNEIPKGCIVATPLSKKSLFQLFCERLQRLKTLATDEGFEVKANAPLYVMTSADNHDGTVSFFKENAYFGLNPSCVMFFEQALAPTFDLHGNFLLKNATTLTKNPDGNGGIFRTLKEKGVIDDMEERGILYLHVFSVDNILCKVADPVFVGYCSFCKAEIGNKCVTRNGPFEKVGVFCSKSVNSNSLFNETAGQRTGCVVEYCELPDDMRHSRDPESKALLFSAGNICNHLFSFSIMKKLAETSWMQDFYHVARKKVAYYDASKDCVIYPETNNAIKLEHFVFDAFECHGKIVALEVSREEEFAPIKNSTGVDSIETASAMMSALHNKWVKKAKIHVQPPQSEEQKICEISPLLSYGGENLEMHGNLKILYSYPLCLGR